MSRCKYMLLILLIFGVGITPVGAVCNYEEQAQLNREVANVDANYEIVERDLPKDMCYPLDGYEDEDYPCSAEFIQINILNLSENMVVQISDDVYNSNITYTYDDTDSGKITFLLTDQNGDPVQYNPDVIEYTIRINASSKTGCEGSTLRTIYLTLPRYNSYANLGYCSNLSDYYLCQRYVAFDKISYDSFYQNIIDEINDREEQQIAEEKSWYEKMWDFVVEHKVAFIVGGIVVVSAGAVGAYIIIRRRRDVK